MGIEIYLRPVLRLLYCGTYLVAATVEDDVVMDTKDVLNNFKERESEESFLLGVIKKAYDAACSEPIACQGYLVREIIEKSGVLEDD